MEKFVSFLADHRWSYQKVDVFLSPRRIVFYAFDIATAQTSCVQKLKGPPVTLALDNQGQATPALKGFLNKCGTDQWNQEETPQGAYVFALLQMEALTLEAFLVKHFPSFIHQLPLKKTMKWKKYTFIRPVRWLCALYGSMLIPLELFGVGSCKFISGLHGENQIPMNSSEEYFQTIKEHDLVISMQERIDQIKSAIPVLSDDSPIVENANRTESPQVIKASYPAKYAALPAEVIYTVINDQMKCFPEFAINDKKAGDSFYFVMNGKKDQSMVRKGFEKVVSARLNDASYFFDQDTKESMSDRYKRLQDMIFMEKLGTIGDKMNRIHQAYLQLGLKDSYPQLENLLYLMKNDLSCTLVSELPELQGVMGRIYALKEQISEEIAFAIEDHYKPRHEQDSMPRFFIAVLAGIIDRSDTLIGSIGMGIPFSGSADPFGLRRCMNGLVRLLFDFDIPFSLGKMLDVFKNIYQASNLSFTKSYEETMVIFSDWLNQRTYSVLAQTYRYDLVQAAMNDASQYPRQIRSKLDILQEEKSQPEFQNLCESYTRINNLLKNTTPAGPIQIKLMEQPEEHGLFQSLEEACKAVMDSPALSKETFKFLYQLNQPVQLFFDHVFVMSEQEQIKNNRLRIIYEVRELIHRFFDLSKVVFEGGNSL